MAGAFGASPTGQVAAVFDVDSGELVTELTGSEGATDARFSRDGTRVLVAGGQTRSGGWVPGTGQPPDRNPAWPGPRRAGSGARLLVTGSTAP